MFFSFQRHCNTFLILSSYFFTTIATDTLTTDSTQNKKPDNHLPTSSWQLDRNHYADPLLTSLQSPTQQRRTLIIVQDSAPGPEVEVLDATSRVNRAYAKRWNHDYLRFTGVALGSEVWQAIFNKPFLLSNFLRARAGGDVTEGKRLLVEEDGNRTDAHARVDAHANTNTTETLTTDTDTTAATHRKLQTSGINDMSTLLPYDTVLFLDSNAMIVQLDYDVLDLIAKDKMLAIVNDVGKDQIRQTSGGKDSDVMMWNLEHPRARSVSRSWIETAQTNLHDTKANSHSLLMNVLHDDGSQSANLLDPIPEPMVDGLHGTVIKQDSKYTKNVVERSDLPEIMPVVQGIADSVCYRFYPQCEVV